MKHQGKATLVHYCAVYGEIRIEVRSVETELVRQREGRPRIVYITYTEDKKKAHRGVSTKVVPDNCRFSVVEVAGKVIYDSRDEVPVDMEVWSRRWAERGGKPAMQSFRGGVAEPVPANIPPEPPEGKRAMKTVVLGQKSPLARDEVLGVLGKVMPQPSISVDYFAVNNGILIRCHRVPCQASKDPTYELVCRSEEEAVRVRGWLREGGYVGRLDALKTPEEFPDHPAAGLFPLMGDAELAALGQDIKEHGLREPIVIHEAKVLDGRNRLLACKLVGVEPRFEWWQPGGGAYQNHPFKGSPVDLVLSLNLHRRHLTAEQKREVIAAVLKADPSKSDRRVAGQVKADHKTVGKVRAEMEGRGEIPHVEARADTRGRHQPAARVTPREAAGTPHEPGPTDLPPLVPTRAESCPHSERLVRWLKAISSQQHVIDIELGGIAAMLAERGKWDWRDVREFILPMLAALAVTVEEFRAEIQAHAGGPRP